MYVGCSVLLAIVYTSQMITLQGIDSNTDFTIELQSECKVSINIFLAHSFATSTKLRTGRDALCIANCIYLVTQFITSVGGALHGWIDALYPSLPAVQIKPFRGSGVVRI
jgi:uncharacterized protein with PQ loop repeat